MTLGTQTSMKRNALSSMATSSTQSLPAGSEKTREHASLTCPSAKRPLKYDRQSRLKRHTPTEAGTKVGSLKTTNIHYAVPEVRKKLTPLRVRLQPVGAQTYRHKIYYHRHRIGYLHRTRWESGNQQSCLWIQCPSLRRWHRLKQDSRHPDDLASSSHFSNFSLHRLVHLFLVVVVVVVAYVGGSSKLIVLIQGTFCD